MHASFLAPGELLASCAVEKLSGLRPHPWQSLARIHGAIIESLLAGGRGIVVLAIDGLGWAPACAAWTAAQLRVLTSTFPSTSVTAWMTAVTGVDVSLHHGIGVVYRSDAHDCVVHVGSNRPVGFAHDQGHRYRRPPNGDELIAPHPTVFEHARDLGVRCVVLGRELDRLRSPWTRSLLRGAERAIPGDPIPGKRPDGTILNPQTFADGVIEQVERTLASHDPGCPLLVWVYVNLDDHIHLRGDDMLEHLVLQRLEAAAMEWRDRGWTVLAHGDHGQVPSQTSAELERVWRHLDSSTFCRLPSGGAGRVRWLYPKPGMEARVRCMLSVGLSGHAAVASPDELAEWGLLRLSPALRQRIGEVIAIATSADFPVPNPALRYEHGSVTAGEMLVPLAVWSVSAKP